MRANGVRCLDLTCNQCRHQTIWNVDHLPGDVKIFSALDVATTVTTTQSAMLAFTALSRRAQRRRGWQQYRRSRDAGVG